VCLRCNVGRLTIMKPDHSVFLNNECI
jgi:hypothetical protein